jgi:riboflavin biosynthesis pyrimidine reductase
VTLNHHIIERLKMLELLEAHKSMMQFHPGARVSFDSPDGERLTGTVEKFNRRPVTVVIDTSQRWNISPHLLSPIKYTQAWMVVDIKPKKRSNSAENLRASLI